MLTKPNELLVDTTLADEIALLGDVLAAAAAADHRLTPEQVDHALGLTQSEREPAPQPPSHAQSCVGVLSYQTVSAHLQQLL